MSSLSPANMLRRLHECISDVTVRKHTIALAEDDITVKTRVSFKADRQLAKEQQYDELYSQLVDYTHKLLHLVSKLPPEEDYTYRHHNTFTNDHHIEYGSAIVCIKVTIKAPPRTSDTPLKDYEMDDKVGTIVEDKMFRAAKALVSP
ncbi:MAG: hypothetical protein Q4B06_00665 [Candidatus Saccharibacteria bacterium]|nr:hypothetical protein [Candidatus Saccharibacteria bacterium]